MTNQILADSAARQIQDVSTNGVYTEINDPEIVQTADPILEILAAFYSIPSEYHADLFNGIREAADSQDLRRLLDTISDWAATAELYAHPKLAAELTEAINGRQEITDWLPG